MTAYFDKVDVELRDVLSGSANRAAELFDEIEHRLVFDCTVAAESPGFPEDLRDAVHGVVLRYGICTLPLLAPPADFETIEEHWRRLGYLSGDLHTVFHEVGRRELVGFNDSPLAPLRRLCFQGQERREQMVSAAKKPS